MRPWACIAITLLAELSPWSLGWGSDKISERTHLFLHLTGVEGYVLILFSFSASIFHFVKQTWGWAWAWGGVTESSQHALGLNEEVPAKSILGVRGC